MNTKGAKNNIFSGLPKNHEDSDPDSPQQHTEQKSGKKPTPQQNQNITDNSNSIFSKQPKGKKNQKNKKGQNNNQQKYREPQEYEPKSVIKEETVTKEESIKSPTKPLNKDSPSQADKQKEIEMKLDALYKDQSEKTGLLAQNLFVDPNQKTKSPPKPATTTSPFGDNKPSDANKPGLLSDLQITAEQKQQDDARMEMLEKNDTKPDLLASLETSNKQPLNIERKSSYQQDKKKQYTS